MKYHRERRTRNLFGKQVARIEKKIAELVASHAEIKESANQIANDFEVKLKYDAAKQEQVDKLYNENQQYKEGILEEFRKSLILAVIEKIDEAEKMIAAFDSKEFNEENYRKLLNDYQSVADEFSNVLLERFDVSKYSCEPETPFEPRRQRSLKTITADDPAKHKLVKQTLRSGYEIDGTVLRPEMVEVYVAR